MSKTGGDQSSFSLVNIVRENITLGQIREINNMDFNFFCFQLFTACSLFFFNWQRSSTPSARVVTGDILARANMDMHDRHISNSFLAGVNLQSVDWLWNKRVLTFIIYAIIIGYCKGRLQQSIYAW